MGIYTSRYSNKELADGKYYCVGISIGTPKFKLAYRLENQCYSLAPKGYMLRMDLEDFKKAYYEKLNGMEWCLQHPLILILLLCQPRITMML